MFNQSDDSIKSWALFKGMSDEEINRVLDRSNNIHYKNGDVLCKQGDASESMYIILFGRVQIEVTKPDGKKQILNVLNHGDHFGELSLLTDGTRVATVTAIVDTTVLCIKKKRFQRLIHEFPIFSINLSNTISAWLQGELLGKSVRHKIAVVGLIQTSSITQNFTIQIVQYFCQKGRVVDVFTDRIEYWEQQNQACEIRQIHEIPKDLNKAQDVIRKIGLIEANREYDHVFLDIGVSPETSVNPVTRKLLNQCERTWVFTDHASEKSLGRLVERLAKNQDAILNRIQIVSVQANNLNDLKKFNHNLSVKKFDLHCQYDPKTKILRRVDLSRFYHAITGVHIGLALGGGGARTLAHIGVLAALEENGLYIDRIAGTSGGAIIAALYSAGLGLNDILGLFKKEMSPPKWLQLIPRSSKWHLMALFRFGLLEQRFKRYLKDYSFDQLLLPCHMLCADLISGNEVVRSNGSVVDSILESINHPLLSRPIYRDGLSLVDGGVLNNVPSSVLRKHNCDFVISVDVGAKIAETFGKNHSKTPQSEMKNVSYLGTLNRVLEIREKGLTTHQKHSDFLIQPDASKYPFDNFTYGKELFELGYDAAMEVMPELKRSYDEFIEGESNA